MELFYRNFGEGPPLIIVHGLYGASDNWLFIGRSLASNFDVYLVDQRNHGQSPHSDSHNYTAMKDDLLTFMDRQDLQKAILVGHSMGGKTVMFLAETHPERIDSLIVIDIAPTTCHPDDHTSQSRTHTQIISGMLSVDFSQVNKREDVDRQLARSIHSPKIRSFLMKNVHRGKDGNYRWKLNAAVIEKELPSIFEGIDLSKYTPGTGITGFPVLFIRGEKSDYISDDCISDIKKIFPMAEIATIPQAGHWLHVEQPDLLIKTIRYFL
ncbi:MAG: alpha/beta fold hydrolase [Bacteroidales bacterium]|nr:alpha/beta fold hydrolase [Bacteroidales bacterium]